MKRAIINQLGQLSEQLKAYVGALNYRYLNLCVKAEEVSLLPIQVPIEDEFKNLEDVAYAGKRTGDDYSLYIVPKIQDDMRDIQQAVMKFHPEFIQENRAPTLSTTCVRPTWRRPGWKPTCSLLLWVLTRSLRIWTK